MKQEPLFTLLQQFGPLPKEVLEDFSAILHHQVFSKNEVLLEIGDRAKYVFYIHKGLARAYYYHEGKDVSDYFAIDGQLLGAVPSLFTGQPSKKGLQLIEESEVHYFLNSDFDRLCAKYHKLEHVARKLLGLGLMQEQLAIESLRFYSVRERYELMESKYPGITNRCPLHYIASYLGTTQVSISRIRAGLQ